MASRVFNSGQQAHVVGFNCQLESQGQRESQDNTFQVCLACGHICEALSYLMREDSAHYDWHQSLALSSGLSKS